MLLGPSLLAAAGSSIVTQQNSFFASSELCTYWIPLASGYPLVDACMRELSITGYTSNHARMNAASFLACSMSFDWRPLF